MKPDEVVKKAAHDRARCRRALTTPDGGFFVNLIEETFGGTMIHPNPFMTYAKVGQVEVVDFIKQLTEEPTEEIPDDE